MSFRTVAAVLLISTAVAPVLALDALPNVAAQNPYASSARYGSHSYNPAQPTAFPSEVPNGTFHVELPKFPRIIGGPTTRQQLASTDPNYLWVTTTSGVVYADIATKRLRQVAAIAAPGTRVVPLPTLDKLTAQPIGSVEHAKNVVKELGVDARRLDVNAHAVVDKDNVLFTSGGDGFIYAYGLTDPKRPEAGIKLLRALDLRTHLAKVSTKGPTKSIQKDGARVTGLALSYDGYLVIGTSRSLAIAGRDFKGLQTVDLAADEVVLGGLALDANGGIFVATNTALHKLVWTGKRLSRDAANGAWSSPYDRGREPPTPRTAGGSSGTPALMGFGSDPHKLVVITDGADRMKLVAFWRDEIPPDFKQQPATQSRRIAGQIEVSAGLSPKPEFIQSTEPVVVKDYGAFVVNHVRSRAQEGALVDALVTGPVLDPARGVERFEWEPSKRSWRSVWARPDVIATSMVPAVSTRSGLVLVHGYTKEGWEISGLDWKTGTTVHRSMFGRDALGNGAYAFIQFLPNGDLLFNSIGGPIRVHYMAVIARPKT